jgi:antitoxin (DNA-binding transcriptional repressor) of toxin-antitoxin stability system
MRVDTADLEEHLADYLKQIRSTGEAITICEGEEPVAILTPLVPDHPKNGANLIERLLVSPLPVKDFKPLRRTEIYDGR